MKGVAMKDITRAGIAIALAIIVVILAAQLDPDIFLDTRGNDIASRLSVLHVNGETFEVWGYNRSRFSLNDIAYILNDTSAQFNIRYIDDEQWDFWIVRGEQYTPTGDEFKPIPGRWIRDGAIEWYGINHPVNITVAVGFDGEDYPATTVHFSVLNDIDEPRFSLHDLSFWLGFRYERYGRITLQP